MTDHVHNSPESYDNVRDFLFNNSVGTLATVSPDGRPYASVLYYVANTDLTVCFITKRRTTKATNIEQNSSVSFVVFEAQTQTVTQIEGSVIEITDEPEASPIFEKVLQITGQTSDSGVPPISKIFDAGHYVAYKIIPHEIRLAVFSRPDPGTYNQFEVIKF